MSHVRLRHVQKQFLKKLKHSPVIALQGPRQCGKSFLVRELLSKKLAGAAYETFDNQTHRRFATENPDTFLEQRLDHEPLIIDEAQKAPAIFDAVKLQVDQDRRPGRYILLGSTEFSKLSLIRESLTGRMTRIRLYPMNLGEVKGLPAEGPIPNVFHNKPRVTRREFLKYLERGGMPGIFGVHTATERESFIEDWVDLCVQRDIHTFPKLKLDSDSALEILHLIAKLPEPTAGAIARATRMDARRVQTYLKVFLALFVIVKLNPHPLGAGKPKFFLCDVAVAKWLGADFHRQLATALILEQMSQWSYGGAKKVIFYHYQTSRGSIVDLIVAPFDAPMQAIKVFDQEKIDKRNLLVLEALGKRGKNMKLLGVGPEYFRFKDLGIEIHPWESMA